MPFGIQWDLVCKFLEVKTNLEYADIATNSTWGNYSNIGWTSNIYSKYSDDLETKLNLKKELLYKQIKNIL